MQQCLRGTFHYYCPWLTKIQLTCTARVESLNAHTDSRGKTNRTCQKHKSLSLNDFLSTGWHLLVCFISNKPKVKYMHHCKHTEHYRKQTILSHVHKTWLPFSLMHFQLEYLGYWSQKRDGWLSPAQTTAKVNHKLLSYCHRSLCQPDSCYWFFL